MSGPDAAGSAAGGAQAPRTPTPAEDDAFLAEAISLAREHMLAGDGGPFGALVVRDGQVIARGWNRVTSTNDPTAHAEVVAIRAACATLDSFELHGCTVYTSCEPCPMCLATCYWARVARIVYAATRDQAAAAGFSDALIYDEIPKAPDARQLPMDRRLADASSGPFDAWAQKADRVTY